MSFGVIEYNLEGKPKCEICGDHFLRVLTHVRQKHNMSEKEYKKQFGFDLHKGICSKESSELSRERVLENYDKCIGENLIAGGAKTRVVKGGAGRTRDKVSEQTRLMLVTRLKKPSPQMKSAMEESGHRVGKSGLGNKARWANKK